MAVLISSYLLREDSHLNLKVVSDSLQSLQSSFKAGILGTRLPVVVPVTVSNSYKKLKINQLIIIQASSFSESSSAIMETI
jgi:hypothetical protein